MDRLKKRRDFNDRKLLFYFYHLRVSCEEIVVVVVAVVPVLEDVVRLISSS